MSLRWIMCAGLALHLLVMGISGTAGGASRAWTFGWALPCTVLPFALAAIGAAMGNEVLVWLFVVPLIWMSVYSRGAARSAASTSR